MYHLKYKKPFGGLRLPKYKISFLLRRKNKFFRGFCFLKYKKFSRRGFLIFFKLRLKSTGFRFRKNKKTFLLRKYKNFLVFEEESFVTRNIRNFFRVDCFLVILGLGWEVRQKALKYTTVLLFIDVLKFMQEKQVL